MGGNALKNCFTRRYQKDEYNDLSKEVINILKKSENILNINIPFSYRNKESFGDMDIVISFNKNFDIGNYIKKSFNPKQIVSNGDCISFEYKEFQIDLIKSNEHYYTNLEYLNWNDLGNIIGRVAHKFGLKYGHKGLAYIIKNESGYNPRELMLTENILDILDFLGFDYDRYTFGFDNVSDIYDFVIESKFFNPIIFSFEEMNHINRVRNKKRITYKGFLEYINTKDLTNKTYFQYNSNKEIYLARINYYFPEAHIFDFIENYKNDIEKKEFIKSKFNGDLVSQITGLSDKNLGEFITYFKNKFYIEHISSDIAFDDWILDKDIDNIKISILNAFNASKLINRKY
ncbi:MAG: hypothetical protein U0354_00785 [Candidatus Sericytochromatia bacterium]